MSVAVSSVTLRLSGGSWRSVVRPALFMLVFLLGSSVPYFFLSRVVSSRSALAHGYLLYSVDKITGIPDGWYSLLSGPGWSGLYEIPHVLLLLGFAPAMLVFAPRRVAWAACLELVALFVIFDLVFLFFPAAPPWALFHSGAMPISAGVARYSTFPSYHVALGCVVGRYGGEVGRWYAVCIAILVVVTGNHWLIDVGVAILVEYWVVSLGRALGAGCPLAGRAWAWLVK